MPEPESEPIAAPTARPKNANKRTPAQKAADAVFIQHHHLRGASTRKIAHLLNTSGERHYTLTHAQVAKDLGKLKKAWLKEAADSVATEKKRALLKLDHLEDELWEAWERSKRDELQRTAAKTAEGGASQGEGGGARTTDSVRKINRDGDAAFTKQILDIQDRRAKLLGLDEPAKTEVSGPGGTPIAVALTDEAQEAILQRHIERMERRKAEANGAATAAPDPA